jgi:histidine triad (HIT) family protein
MPAQENCIFCQIIAKQIPANIVFEDDNFIVFKDINPKAKLHLLVVPKEHIASLAHLEYNHKSLLGEAMLLLNNIALQNNATTGFRTIINTGRGGGQEVDHLHIHLLAGKLPNFG